MLARLLPELGQDRGIDGRHARPSAPRPRPGCSRRSSPCWSAWPDRSPTVLVVEDLHWADRSTLDLLTFLVRNLPAALLLVLTYRDDELHRRHPLRPFLAGAGPERQGRTSRAEPLRPGRDGRPARRHPRGQTGRRAGRAHLPPVGGQRVLRGGVARRDPPGWRAEPSPSLENVLLSRVQDLPRTRRRHCDWWPRPADRSRPSCWPRSASFPMRTCSRRYVTRSPIRCSSPTRSPRRYAFRHALTQEALYAELLPGERARLHARFARGAHRAPANSRRRTRERRRLGSRTTG